MSQISTLKLIAFLLFITPWLHAQEVEQVSVGAGYTEQAFYNLATGEVISLVDTEWDIAFSNLGQIDGGIFINESSGLSGTALEVYLAETTDWSEAITDVTPYVDSVRLHNPELDWENGAFNEPKDTTSAFDYGWGAYNINSHQIEGNRIFLIKKRSGAFIKFMVNSLVSGVYEFRYAELDNSNEIIHQVDKAEGGTDPLIYFSFASGDHFILGIDYDLVFQRYTTPLDAGDGLILEYTVMGVLLAPGTQAVVADGVDVETVDEADYADQYTSLPTVIGHEWKAFDFTQGWIMDEDRAQFVRTKDGSIYKIVFFDFEGSSTGVTTLEKTYLGMSANANVELEGIELSIFPNPVSQSFTIDHPSVESLDISIFNTSGQLVQQSRTRTGDQVALSSSISNGLYFVAVHLHGQTATKPLYIKR